MGWETLIEMSALPRITTAKKKHKKTPDHKDLSSGLPIYEMEMIIDLPHSFITMFNEEKKNALEATGTVTGLD